MIYCLELKLFSIIKISLGFNTEDILILIQKLRTFRINRTAVTFSYFIFSVIIVIRYIVTAEIIKSTSTAKPFENPFEREASSRRPAFTMCVSPG